MPIDYIHHFDKLFVFIPGTMIPEIPMEIFTSAIVAPTRKLRARWSVNDHAADLTPREPRHVFKRYRMTEEPEGDFLVIKRERDLKDLLMPFHYAWEGTDREYHTIGGFRSEESVMRHMKDYHHLEVGINLEEVPLTPEEQAVWTQAEAEFKSFYASILREVDDLVEAQELRDFKLAFGDATVTQ